MAFAGTFANLPPFCLFLGLGMGDGVDTALRRNGEIIAAPVGTEELVMLSVAAGRYYSLNPVGRRLWELLEQPRTVPELCAAISAEFEVDAQTCQADVVKFVTEMMDNGLLDAADT
jgi:hypothetical protein